MKRIFPFVIILIILNSTDSFGTHNRAGEITYEQISDLTYAITITTFTYTESPADRSELEVRWGDNTTSIAGRYEKVRLPNFYFRNKYSAKHTFPGPGTYEIIVQDPNRNFGVLNIPNSVNVIFSITTTLVINSNVGSNNTPVLLNPPIDKAAKGHVFIHNPSAFDYDGDSISYKLTICRGENGVPIENYTFPRSSNKPIYIDEITGDLVWDSPVDTGIYNIAIDVEEWREGIKIGNIVRDMQVDVYNTDNTPPVLDSLGDFCVMAGDSISFTINSIDINNDSIFHIINGGPFQYSNAPEFKPISWGFGFLSSRFVWKTNCINIRKQPYNIIIKAQDVNDDLPLVDIENVFIRVIAPPPKNLNTFPTSNSINLEWNSSQCGNISQYHIYRRETSAVFIPDSCTSGIPDDLGYMKIAEISGSDTTFTDDNNGEGLIQGIEFCYRVVAVYEDGAKSYASNESCTSLIPGSPSVLNVSVTDISETSGAVFLSWAKPRKLDTIPALGPYEYRIYRSNDLKGTQLELLEVFETNDLNDTTFTDAPLNTLAFPYSYQIELYNNTPGNRFLIGNPEIASTFYPQIVSSDNKMTLQFIKNTPWLNNRYVVFKLNETTQLFDSIGFTLNNTFVDSNLVNGKEYCYKARSYGFREIHGMMYHNINLSHENCGIPIDTVPPCPPELNVVSNCDSLANILTWTNPNLTCSDDAIKYNIYYTNELNTPLEIIQTIEDINETTFVHISPYGTAGCYAVTAIDSFDNESRIQTKVCVDECSGYKLPNVFSPNDDGDNDIYMSINPNGYVKKVKMRIFNRWGNLVYETEDPDINWDGRNKENNRIVSSGVYYYICDVFEPRLVGIVVRNLVGFIHVYAEEPEDTLIE